MKFNTQVNHGLVLKYGGFSPKSVLIYSIIGNPLRAGQYFIINMAHIIMREKGIISMWHRHAMGVILLSTRNKNDSHKNGITNE